MATLINTGIRWEPRGGHTVLDSITSEYAPGFHWGLKRNGHVVALYLVESAAVKARDERIKAMPLDTWEVYERD